MTSITRRSFLQLGAHLTALMGLGTSAIPKIADALTDLSNGTAPVVWLQGLSCSGCSVSFLNAETPGALEILTNYISLKFHATLSTATGDIAIETLYRALEEEDCVLVVEGAMPVKMPRACMLGEEPVTQQVLRAARKAKAVMAVGACASFGGIPAAENNPTGAQGVRQFLHDQQLTVPVINVPGCPAHPDWTIGTLIHLLRFGLPSVDEFGRPLMFYRRLIHDQCPRFSDYERERFAGNFSDEGCLFKLGCLGPTTYADCTLRQWNGGTNYCIKANAPCVGCASHDFALKADFPFYTKGLQIDEA